MATDAPAFDFYPERWTQGTRHMSKIQRCDYLDLLSFQWTEDGLPGDLEAVARIIGYTKSAQIPQVVLVKFPECSDGKRRNARLEQIRAEQRERIKRKSDQRKAAADARWAAERLRPKCGEDATALRAQCPPPTTHHPPLSSLPPAREGNGPVSDSPPSVDDVLGYAKGNAASELRTDVCLAWMDVRERDGWKILKNGHHYEFEDWRADLRGFHRIFVENERDKKARGNGRTSQPSRLSPPDPTKPKPAF